MLSWNFYIIPPGIITVLNVSLYLTGLAVIVLISRKNQVQSETNKMELVLITSLTDFYKSRFS